MVNDTFTSDRQDYKITTYPDTSDSKMHPVLVLLHGNFGLGGIYGPQIQNFAQDLARQGYVTAVPQYYKDDQPHPSDRVPHVQTLADGIAAVGRRADADVDRLGLIGFSLGATTAMTYIARRPPGTVEAFADFFGFLTSEIRGGVSRFPPTIIFHNRNDEIVPVQNAQDLDRILPKTLPHKLVPPYGGPSGIGNHAFEPGSEADVDSRSKTTDWFTTHLPPTAE